MHPALPQNDNGRAVGIMVPVNKNVLALPWSNIARTYALDSKERAKST